MREKDLLRRQCKAAIAHLPDASAKITEKLLFLPAYQSANTVFCFVSMQGEIDTHAFLQSALQSGKTVCVPLCTGKGQMTAKKITALSELQSGAYGISEPKAQAETILPQQIDFAVLPCLAADREGYRLGYGGGYYDRYLLRLRAEAVTVCVCRKALLLPKIPREAHDIAADFVITE